MSGPLNSSAPTTSQIVGGVFNATTPTPADRQACAFQLDSEGNLLVRVVGGGAGVTELNGLTGNLNITGTGITVTPAGTNIVLSLPASGVTPTSYTNANITVNAAGIITAASNGSAGGVTSFIGRTGAVVAVSGDYTVAQVTGAAPIASPTFTGVPTGPTAAAGTNTTQLATTAFVLGQSFITAATAPVTSVFGRTGAVLAVSGDYTVAQVTGAAPIASPTFTGTATFDLTSSSVANIATFQQLGSQSGYVTLSAPLAFQTAISFNDNTNGADFLVYRPAGTQDLSIFSITAGNQLYFAQAGGIYVGAATGGSEGAGTVNVSSGYYVNGAALGTWVNYTPTVTATTGTITTATATGRYTKIGKTVTVAISVDIIASGSGAGNVLASLPFTAGASSSTFLVGREAAVTGLALIGIITPNTTVASILSLSPSPNSNLYGTYPGVNGYVLQISGTYESST